jgi:hypothetical protein
LRWPYDCSLFFSMMSMIPGSPFTNTNTTNNNNNKLLCLALNH